MAHLQILPAVRRETCSASHACLFELPLRRVEVFPPSSFYLAGALSPLWQSKSELQERKNTKMATECGQVTMDVLDRVFAHLLTQLIERINNATAETIKKEEAHK